MRLKPKRHKNLVRLAGLILFISASAYLLLFCDPQASGLHQLGIILTENNLAVSFVPITYALILAALMLQRGTRAIEHPLTASLCYRTLYDISPFLGALAGVLAVSTLDISMNQLAVVSIGILITTTAIWVIIDPILMVIEAVLPASRRLRRRRSIMAKKRRLKQKIEKDRILAEVRTKNTSACDNWNDKLLPYARDLADLVMNQRIPEAVKQAKAVDIGLYASHIGGQACMRYLYRMTQDMCGQKDDGAWIARSISIWWDGIGGWGSH